MEKGCIWAYNLFLGLDNRICVIFFLKLDIMFFLVGVWYCE